MLWRDLITVAEVKPACPRGKLARTEYTIKNYAQLSHQNNDLRSMSPMAACVLGCLRTTDRPKCNCSSGVPLLTRQWGRLIKLDLTSRYMSRS